LALSKCVDPTVQLNVRGVVMGTPSTETASDAPVGLESTVTRTVAFEDGGANKSELVVEFVTVELGASGIARAVALVLFEVVATVVLANDWVVATLAIECIDVELLAVAFVLDSVAVEFSTDSPVEFVD